MMELLTREGKVAETTDEKLSAVVDYIAWEQDCRQKQETFKRHQQDVEEARNKWFFYGICIGICMGIAFAVYMNTSPKDG